MLQYGHCIDQMYQKLLQFKKNRFDPTDRIIFIFSDTEYYIENQFGLTLANTYKIIDYLGIPAFCCLFVTEQDYVKKNVLYLNQTYYAYDNPVQVIEVYIDHSLSFDNLPSPINYNFNKIKKSYIFLSNQSRKHRSVFYSLLDKHLLLDNGQVSFRLAETLNKIKFPAAVTSQFDLPTDLEIVLPHPYSICNENWKLVNQEVKEIFDIFVKHTPKDFIFKNFNETSLPHLDINCANVNLMQQSFLYIAAETMFNYPGSYLTEKSFKGISCKRPFVILGPKNSLKKLKEYGFKTFDHWWDESYDDINDPSERLLAVFDIVKTISQKSNDELIELAFSLTDVLEYNYNHLTKNFINSQLDNLNKQCLK